MLQGDTCSQARSPWGTTCLLCSWSLIGWWAPQCHFLSPALYSFQHIEKSSLMFYLKTRHSAQNHYQAGEKETLLKKESPTGRFFWIRGTEVYLYTEDPSYLSGDTRSFLLWWEIPCRKSSHPFLELCSSLSKYTNLFLNITVAHNNEHRKSRFICRLSQVSHVSFIGDKM